ncbi:MAG: Sir2 family NAD-dependent protein deacetylase [Candidatus Omnitrophica bacterium]|nr:Sir2 family NAD-dependent protein deacetylase [Candidatus Omnitrophota bacterium]MDE2222828.1 Sir2 family NAD-dependent protein deacetylase [Candidatus Omnitrophota bacterium]
MPPDPITRCAELILQSNRTVCLTGAGVSTSAGIPDFRGPQGLYVSRLYDPEKVFDIDYFLKDPKPFYEFARDFISLETSIKPTFTHYALAALERAGKLQAVITQNIDGLHEKSGSTKVLDMHGSFLSSHCLKCRKVYDYTSLKAMILRQGIIPHCSCRGVIKPDIVFFGEDVKYYHESLELAQNADLFLVIGTSCAVYPAASLPQFVPGKVAIINNTKVGLNVYNIAVEVESDIDTFFKALMEAVKIKLNI